MESPFKARQLSKIPMNSLNGTFDPENASFGIKIITLKWSKRTTCSFFLFKTATI
jgi:hypothetical protein